MNTMNWEQIHPQLATLTEHQFPTEAVAACNANPDAVRSPLLAELSRLVANPEQFEPNDDETFWFAGFLLAQWREPQLFPLLLSMARWSEDQLDQIWGDNYLSDFPRWLAACCHGEVAELLRLAHDQTCSYYLRNCGIAALAILVIENELPRETAVRYFRQIAATCVVELDAIMARSLDADDLPFEAATSILGHLADMAGQIGASEMLDEALAWFRMDYLDEEQLTEADIRAMFANRKPAAYMYFLRNAAAQISSYEFFQSVAERQARHDKMMATMKELLKTKAAKPSQHISPEPVSSAISPAIRQKVGRNDPCPCGSGKKYKKCCGNS